MDPVLELQGLIIARLRSDAVVAALVGQRSYDIPPLNNSGEVTADLFPYISIGPTSYETEDVDCIPGGEVMIQIDAWSAYQGNTEVRQIADAVRRAIRGAEFALIQNALVTFDHWRTDFLRDGVVKHASIRFTAIVEEH
jgi:hypothetical protein